MQPLFVTVRFISIKLNLGLQLRHPILGRAKLMRKLLCHMQGVSAVLFSNAGSFVKQAQNSGASLFQSVSFKPQTEDKQATNPHG